MNVNFDTQWVYENGYNSGNGENNNEDYVPVEFSPIKEQRPYDQDCVIREQIGAKKLADIFSNLSVSKTPSNNKLLQEFEHTFKEITVLLINLGMSPEDLSSLDQVFTTEILSEVPCITERESINKFLSGGSNNINNGMDEFKAKEGTDIRSRSSTHRQSFNKRAKGVKKKKDLYSSNRTNTHKKPHFD